jgi:hypothetical protein
MGKSQRKRQEKHCDGCLKNETVLYRIKVQLQDPWVFMCSACQSKVKEQPSYQYGGTWKQSKRN